MFMINILLPNPEKSSPGQEFIYSEELVKGMEVSALVKYLSVDKIQIKILGFAPDYYNFSLRFCGNDRISREESFTSTIDGAALIMTLDAKHSELASKYLTNSNGDIIATITIESKEYSINDPSMQEIQSLIQDNEIFKADLYISDVKETIGQETKDTFTFNGTDITLSFKINPKEDKDTFADVNVSVLNSVRSVDLILRVGIIDKNDNSYPSQTVNISAGMNIVANQSINLQHTIGDILSDPSLLTNGTLHIYSEMTEVESDQSFEESSGDEYPLNQVPDYNVYSPMYNMYSQNHGSAITYGAAPAKAETADYAGLENQGATCYMNALLQSLFHIPQFRRIVYDMPTTASEKENKSIPLNLQRLFAQMQLGRDPVSTVPLTQSFGWGDAEAFMQHDVQEFCRVLLDNIETKLKGTPLDGSIANLFRGKFRSFVRCKNVDYQTERIEDFYDLQLNVRGMGTLERSFEEYTKVETLDGDNQYETEGFGKQDAQIGVEFVEMPPVLQIHLRRFEYDMNTWMLTKLSERLAFPERLPIRTATEEVSYQLMGVIVHAGTADFGHYFAYLKTANDSQWYLFNDSHVTKSTREAAVEGNYGGKSAWMGSSENAYLLVYVREESAPAVYEAVPDDSIPEHLREYAETAKLQQQKIGTGFDSIRVQIETTEDLMNYTACVAPHHRPAIRFQFDRKRSFRELFEEVGERAKLPVSRLKLWRYQGGRVELPVEPSERAVSAYYFDALMTVKGDDEPYAAPDDSIAVTMKFFFPGAEFPLQFIGETAAPRDSTVSSLFKMACELAEIEETPLRAYEQKTLSDAFPIPSDTSFSMTSFGDGVNIIFAPADLAPVRTTFAFSRGFKAEDDVKVDFEYTRAVDNPADFLAYRSKMLCFEVRSVESPAEAICTVRIPAALDFAEIKKYVAECAGLRFDPARDSMLLYGESISGRGPATTAIDTNIHRCGRSAFRAWERVQPLYVLVVPGADETSLKGSALFSVQYSEDGRTVASRHRLLGDRAGCCGSLYAALVRARPDVSQRIAAAEDAAYVVMSNGHVASVGAAGDPLPAAAEVIRIEPRQEGKTTPVVNCLIVNGYAEAFGTPFITRLLDGEQWADTKKRVLEEGLADEIVLGGLPPLDKDKEREYKDVKVLRHVNKIDNVRDLKDDQITVDVMEDLDQLFIVHQQMPRHIRAATTAAYNSIWSLPAQSGGIKFHEQDQEKKHPGSEANE